MRLLLGLALAVLSFAAPQSSETAFVPVLKLYVYRGGGTIAAPPARVGPPAPAGRGHLPLDRRQVESVNSR